MPGTLITKAAQGPGTMNIDEEVNVKKAVDEAKNSDVVVLVFGGRFLHRNARKHYGFDAAGNAVEICRRRLLRPESPSSS